jgi:hypothetical protein
MIIESIKLKQIFDFSFFPEIDTECVNLEISRVDHNDIIAINYSDSYYVSYSTEDEENSMGLYENSIILSNIGLKKLWQLVNIWPKSMIKIENNDNGVSLEIVNHGQLLRERPVQVECFFGNPSNNYIIEPPQMDYSCIICSKNLRQMMEFCQIINDGIFLEVKGKSLSITSSDMTLASLVELEELKEHPSKKIKLSEDSVKLIILFLNKIVGKYNTVYLLFLDYEKAFSIKTKIDNSVIQIYTVHDS